MRFWTNNKDYTVIFWVYVLLSAIVVILILSSYP